jgi:thiamine biosynthesis protein ThiS
MERGGAAVKTIPRLMLVTDRRRSRWPLPELVERAVAGGVDAVQLREPDLPAAELLALATTLCDVVDERATLLVNADLGVASALGLGLHLPEAGIATAEARRRLRAVAMIGRSVHSPLAAAAATGADYLIAGNVYPTASHPNRPPIGCEGLARIVAASWAPVLAIGGITAERVPEVIAAGAHGVAVIGAIAAAADPEGAARELRAMLIDITEEAMETAPSGTAESASLTIVVNGKPVEIPPETTITDFLTEKGLRPNMVIVELNGTVIARRAFAETWLAAGDQLEVVHAVGGG